MNNLLNTLLFTIIMVTVCVGSISPIAFFVIDLIKSKKKGEEIVVNRIITKTYSNLEVRTILNSIADSYDTHNFVLSDTHKRTIVDIINSTPNPNNQLAANKYLNDAINATGYADMQWSVRSISIFA